MMRSPLTCAPTRRDICWQAQQLGQEALDLTSDVLASSSSGDQLRNRLDAVPRRLLGLDVRVSLVDGL